jgi:hypothetical protein
MHNVTVKQKKERNTNIHFLFMLVHDIAPSASTTSVHTTNQSKNTSRFNLKTMRSAAPSMSNLFGRKQ